MEDLSRSAWTLYPRRCIQRQNTLEIVDGPQNYYHPRFYWLR